MNFLPCVVIPVYNHKECIENIVEKLEPLRLHCFIIDDGSDEPTQKTLDSIARRHPDVTLHRLPVNKGKGGAVMAGMELAYGLGYSHALQIDADGQHNCGDIQAFLSAAEDSPDTLIAGQPVYDSTVPKGRLMARYITHFWVAIETLSKNPPDTMCGFRVYPLKATCNIIQARSLGQRMDFDIEIMVRLIWADVQIIRIPTKVIYPQNGSSHFRYLLDNALISWMHSRLFFGMLVRLHTILNQKFSNSASGDNKHWSRIKERGTVSGMRALFYLYKISGRTLLNIILVPLTLYFFVTNKPSRAASLKFLNKAYITGSSHKHMAAKPSLATSFRHFLFFSQTSVDKAASWFGDIGHTDIIFDEKQKICDLALNGKGIVIISAHLGNIELARAVADQISARKLNALIFTEHAIKFNSILKRINSKAAEGVIHVNRIGPETAIRLKGKIDNGEFIVILGDRTAVNSMNRVNFVKFLGEDAPFAQGPFILAALMECPVYLMFCLKQEGRYHVYFEHFADHIKLPRKSRGAHLQPVIQRYANRLEYYCLKEPLQWFNFYDFWQNPNNIEYK